MSDQKVNKAGAIIFSDINKHKTLAMPTLLTEHEVGVKYEVLAVGMHGRTNTPIATVKEGTEAVVYILPSELHGWVKKLFFKSMNGMNPLPAEIEFGILDGIPYAK